MNPEAGIRMLLLQVAARRVLTITRPLPTSYMMQVMK
jgi:hypothetical protein